VRPDLLRLAGDGFGLATTEKHPRRGDQTAFRSANPRVVGQHLPSSGRITRDSYKAPSLRQIRRLQKPLAMFGRE
jgi:hypothetical protein